VAIDNPYEAGLGRNPANFAALTPLAFLERAAEVWPSHPAVVHGRSRLSYAAFHERCRRLAGALAAAGIGRGDTVSAMLANTPPMLEAHHGVPMTGAVLHSVNTRLDAAQIAFQLDHAACRLLIADREFADVVRAALALARVKPVLVHYDDPEFPQAPEPLDGIDYERFVAGGSPDVARQAPGDEWDAISLNYTSGTTGDPKGVVYHHRGATLMGYSNVVHARMGPHPVYLWTLPMFHCNGWCFPWTLALVGGTHVCLRQVRAPAIWQALAEEGVTHLCGAPIVMSTILAAEPAVRRPLDRRITFLTAAAPPPEAVLAAMGEAGFEVVHVYGLTEVYGPAVINEWDAGFDALPSGERARLKARQGVRYLALDGLSVRDPESLAPVPADGETLGEVMFRGNIVMKGYLKNPAATQKAFAGGWFRSGDLAVLHPDGFLQIKDRSKDIIISGGENISSIEVEDVLYKHPAVAAAAVVAAPHERWGETPCAFVELRAGAAASTDDLLAFCREHLARYKCPTRIVFGEIPKTSTGKVQKFVLRERAREAT
jgi:fatty-acyl-CoA synthase